MPISKRTYRWLYDHVVCVYYDLLVRWCFLLFGGEATVRRGLLESVPLPAGARVLDLCCGTGGATRFIAERVRGTGRVIAVDLSAGQVWRAARKSGMGDVRFAVMDATRTGFSNAAFECVVIPHALHEMQRAERLAVLAEAARLLAPGGTLAVQEMDTPPGMGWRLIRAVWWFHWVPFNPEQPTLRDMLAHGLDTEVREAGFADVAKVPHCHGTLQVVHGRRP